jgi:hypothetical protein
MKRDEIYVSIKAVQTHWHAAKASAAYFYGVCKDNPTHIENKSGFSLKDIRDCVNDLEDTYLIRAYAVFETTLRDYWQVCIRRTHPPAETLINRLASRCAALADELKGVHAVREYRNWLVHGGAAPAKVAMAEGKSYMCKFLRNLPPSW